MMSYMFEVYYTSPEDAEREAKILLVVIAHKGRLDCRELPESAGGTICLTYEFATEEQAQAAMRGVQNLGEYVEGPYGYGQWTGEA